MREDVPCSHWGEGGALVDTVLRLPVHPVSNSVHFLDIVFRS